MPSRGAASIVANIDDRGANTAVGPAVEIEAVECHRNKNIAEESNCRKL